MTGHDQGHKYTEEQQRIISAASAKTGSALVQAGAGCAKTSTGKTAMQRIKVPGLALAFNRKIADDLAKAMPRSFDARSFNALGHRAWAGALKTQPKLDDRKLGRIITQLAKGYKIELDSSQWSGAKRMVSLAQAAGLVPESDRDGDQSLVPDSRDQWEELGFQAGLSLDDCKMLWELGRSALVENIKMARAGVISFDDQIYCSSMLGGKFPKYPVIFVDEAQDLSPLNIKMLGQCMAQHARVFAVGDENQAIYAWRGASGTSMQDVRGLPAQNWSDYPLMTTFRCPKEVVKRQLWHVPEFRAWDESPDGLVVEWDEGWSWSQLQELIPQGAKEIAVICRNNAPIMSLALKLLRQGIGCFMLGRALGKGLIALAKKIIASDDTPRDKCRGLIETWMVNEQSLAMANDREDRCETISDQGEALLAVLEGAECDDARGLQSVLFRVFARESGQVCLSTIHRAKGLEWPLVMVLDSWRIPGKWAKKAAKAGNTVPLQQEWNLKYVAETRAQQTLVLASLEGFQ